MSIKQKLRDYQDQIRDRGWRIKWIPWQEPGQAEYIHNTPLTLLTGFGGAALFFVSVVYLIVFKHAQWPILAVGLAGLVMIFLGRIYASINKQAGWLYLTARCIDRDIQERHYPSKGNVKIIWEFRLICEFTHNGTKYRVTPEASHTAGFQSQDLVQKYLNARMQPDSTCKLWVNPQNPLHTVFDKKQRI